MALLEQVLVKLRNSLPDSMVFKLRGTFLDSIYSKMKSFDLEMKQIAVDTPEFKVEMKVPTSSDFGEGSHEPVLVEKISELIDENTTFYDVGSQYGFHSIVAKNAGCEDIHCFEADKLIFSILKENVQDAKFNLGFVGQCKSDDLCIDEYVSGNPYPDLVKIDVEGAELNVLRGMEETLSDHKPELLIEVHRNLLKNFDCDIEEFREFLTNQGYNLRWFDHRKEEMHELSFEEISDLNNVAVFAKVD